MANLDGKWAVVRGTNHNSVMDTTDDLAEAERWAREMPGDWTIVPTIEGMKL